jgi:HAMP domain-containing protein
MALIAGIITLIFKPTRRAAILLLLGALSQIAAWMAFTHLQSRFLLPLIVPMSAAFGLGAAAVLTTATRRLGRLRETDAPSRAAMPVLAAIVIGILPLTAAGWSAINFARQLNTQPNRSLIMAAGGLSGMNFERSLLEAPENERLAFINESANPAAYVNLVLRSPDTQPASDDHRDLYLLGDATPLYYLDALGDTPSTATNNLPPDTRPLKVHYHTTWDSSLLGDAIASSPDDPAAWSAFMRSRGIGYILVNYSELGRLIEKDHNYDPRVTLIDVGRWVAPTNRNSTGLTSIRQWTVPIDAAGRNQVVSVELFRIGPPAPSNTSESGTP